jgi:hypothetical protein
MTGSLGESHVLSSPPAYGKLFVRKVSVVCCLLLMLQKRISGPVTPHGKHWSSSEHSS